MFLRLFLSLSRPLFSFWFCSLAVRYFPLVSPLFLLSLSLSLSLFPCGTGYYSSQFLTVRLSLCEFFSLGIWVLFLIGTCCLLVSPSLSLSLSLFLFRSHSLSLSFSIFLVVFVAVCSAFFLAFSVYLFLFLSLSLSLSLSPSLSLSLSLSLFCCFSLAPFHIVCCCPFVLSSFFQSRVWAAAFCLVNRAPAVCEKHFEDHEGDEGREGDEVS